MQLVAYGAQDIYLTGNPQITFFKVVYRRHTNFSMESISQTLNGGVTSNGRSTCTISRNGDLVHKMYLQSVLPDDSTLNQGATQISSVELEIGGQRIDKHMAQWMEAWAELTENKTGRQFGTNYQLTTGMGAGVLGETAATANAADGGAASIFFNNVSTDSQIIYTPLQFWFCRNPGLALPLIALQYHEVKVVFNWGTIAAAADPHDGHQLWVDYIYLDTDERRRFAQVSHEYLIEQVQHQTVAASSSTIDLHFNHPVKELVLTGEWNGGGEGDIALQSAVITNELKLTLNGHDRFSPRPVSYFSRAQVLQHHTGEGGFVDGSILVYSFALKPEEHQPSGTCNFSRIDNAQIKYETGATADAVTHVFAVNYNVLRIMSGMGGLAYSN